MNRDEFLEKFADILQVEEEIKAETILDNLECQCYGFGYAMPLLRA